MEASERRRAVAAAVSVAGSVGLDAGDAVVLSDSNRLVVRLLPSDVVVRVARSTLADDERSSREVELARQLAGAGAPVAGPDPRVEPRAHERDGFAVTFWHPFEPLDRALDPAACADALGRLHADLRRVDMAAPHVADRIAEAQRDVADRHVTPDLSEADRALLAGTLHDLRAAIAERGATEQLLHGEPHPWNVLDTTDGLLFTDFENAARGPVEYDLAWVPDEVVERSAGADLELVDECRGIVLTIIAMHRFRLGDQHPSGRESAAAWVDAVRAGPPWPAIDTVTWAATVDPRRGTG